MNPLPEETKMLSITYCGQYDKTSLSWTSSDIDCLYDKRANVRFGKSPIINCIAIGCVKTMNRLNEETKMLLVTYCGQYNIIQNKTIQDVIPSDIARSLVRKN